MDETALQLAELDLTDEERALVQARANDNDGDDDDNDNLPEHLAAAIRITQHLREIAAADDDNDAGRDDDNDAGDGVQQRGRKRQLETYDESRLGREDFMDRGTEIANRISADGTGGGVQTAFHTLKLRAAARQAEFQAHLSWAK